MHRPKHQAELWYKRHKLRRLATEPQGYPAPAYYNEYEHVGFNRRSPREKPYYKRIYRGKRSAYLKKLAAKKTRQNSLYLPPRGKSYRKQFDFWWELN